MNPSLTSAIAALVTEENLEVHALAIAAICLRSVNGSFFNARYKALNLEQQGSGITYANWMGMALPMSAITLVLGWIVIILLFLRGK